MTSPAESPRTQRAIFIMSLNFLALFSGFQGAQALQTSLLHQLGAAALSVLYACFTIFSLFAPQILSAVESRLAQKYQFIIGGFPYMVMILSNLLDFGTSFRASWVFYIFTSACVGLGAPILWTAQAEFAGRCALKASQETGETLSATSSRFNAMFFSYLQCAGVAGSILSSTVLLLGGDSGDGGKSALFILLGLLVLGALVGFMMLPVIEKNTRDGVETDVQQFPDWKQTLAIGFTDSRTTLALTMTLANGLMLGLILSNYSSIFITPCAGIKLVGFVTAMFFASNAIATRIWGNLISSGRVKRMTALTVATFVKIIFVVILLIVYLTGFEPAYSIDPDTGKWIKINPVQSFRVFLLFCGACFFAIGDSVYESQIPTIFHTLYSGDPNATAAYATYKMWQSLGFCLMFALDSMTTNFIPKGIFALILLVFGWISMLQLNRKHVFEHVTTHHQTDVHIPFDDASSEGQRPIVLDSR